MAGIDDGIGGYQRQFSEFLEHEDLDSRYINKLRQCISDEQYRLVVNINDVRNFDRDLAAA